MRDEFSRLLSDPDQTAVAEVLGSALDDAPSRRRVERAARALGVAPGLALTVGKAAGAGGATVASQSVAGAAFGQPVTVLLWGTLAKWLGAGLLAGSITSLAVSRLPIARGEPDVPPSSGALSRREPEPPASRVGAPPPVEPRARPDVPAASTPTADVRRELAPAAGSNGDVSRVATAVRAASSVPAPASSSLERELARLDEARRAVNAHDPERAQKALAAYDRELEAPALGAEATLLRVQALVEQGRIPEAQRAVKSVLAKHPRDGYTCRLTRLAALGDGGCAELPASP